MSTFNNGSRKFEQNNYQDQQQEQGSTKLPMENHNGNGENGHTPEEFEDDGEGEFVVICKKHHQRGTKFRMRGRGGGGAGGGGGYHNSSYRIPLTAYPYHPSNIRRTQMLLEQQNNVKNNNGDNSSTATTETNSTNDSSIAKNSLPSSSSGTSTLSTASGPASDASSSTTGDVNVNELQPDLDAIAKPKFTQAPIPSVNPWKVFNAAAVLSKKVKPSAAVNSLPLKPSSTPEPITNGVSSHINVAATKANGTSDKATTNAIPVTSTAPPKTWAAVSSEKATKSSGHPPAQTQTAIYQHNDSKPITTTAKSASDSTTTTTASYSAQSAAPAPVPWVSGRVLKLQKSSPNYTEKLKPTEWPSLSEVSKMATIELTNEQPKNDVEETKVEEPASKTSEQIEVNSKVTRSVATQTYTTTSPTPSQTKMNSKETNTPASSSPTYARTEYFDGESRGRGRGASRGGGALRGGRPHSASGHYKDQNNYAASTMVPRTEYTDYPPEYTTLIPPFSTVPDFIMPYVAPTTCRVAPIMSPDLAAVPQWVIAAPPSRATVVDLVKNQIEYYFSQENLEKDFYLRRKMDAEGYLPIRLIASFQRVQSMTTDYSIVTDAIQASSNLEMRQATASVRTRNDPTKWPIDDGGHSGHTQARNGEDSSATTKVPPCTLAE